MKKFSLLFRSPMTWGATAGLVVCGLAMSACGSPAEIRDQQVQQVSTISVPYKGSTVDCVVLGIGSNGPLFSCDWQGYHEKNPTP